jgi:hypothetical protein
VKSDSTGDADGRDGMIRGYAGARSLLRAMAQRPQALDVLAALSLSREPSTTGERPAARARD